jgi:hypothetical protein
MRTNLDPNDEEALLEAVLCDEDWQAAHAAGKAAALLTFQSRQRVRRITREVGGLAVLALLAVGVAHWRPADVAAVRPPVQIAAVLSASPPKPTNVKNLSDEQLLALFPSGSCFLAEVDGKKTLVFFDPNVRRKFVNDAAAPRSLTH